MCDHASGDCALCEHRCGLSVPLTPEEVEARKQKEQQPPSKMWTPDLKGDFAERYGKKIEKRIGPN